METYFFVDQLNHPTWRIFFLLLNDLEQGSSQAFEIGRAQPSKIILGPYCLKYLGANPYFYYSLSQIWQGGGP